MVGIAIGLLVVAVAMVALMASRGISGTVSDASQLQQQGAYAMRVIGSQLRQAGSLYLNPDPTSAGMAISPMSAVAFETNTRAADGSVDPTYDFDQSDTINNGTDTEINTAFRRYKDRVFMDTNEISLSRNCMGLPSDTDTNYKKLASTVSLDSVKLNLMCKGNGGDAPMVGNIAELQFTYMEQSFDGMGSVIQLFKAADVTNWRRVQGVQVCLVMYGTEAIDMPSGSKYTDCSGNEVDMTTLSGNRKNRLHLLLRNTYQLRSQALLENDA